MNTSKNLPFLTPELIKKAQPYLDKKEPSDLLKFLKSEGLSPAKCSIALQSLANQTPGDAKQLVYDAFYSPHEIHKIEELHDQLEKSKIDLNESRQPSDQEYRESRQKAAKEWAKFVEKHGSFADEASSLNWDEKDV